MDIKDETSTSVDVAGVVVEVTEELSAVGVVDVQTSLQPDLITTNLSHRS